MTIHVVGASGSGTTTLGRALAQRLSCQHFDTDDYFWVPTDPPYREIRDRAERQALLGRALGQHEHWVLSGSLCGWGDMFIPRFDVVIFLSLPREIRLARLQAREQERYGNAIAPGGTLHDHHVEFMTWAAAYDDGGLEVRSRKVHEQWLSELPCPVVRLISTESVASQIEQLISSLAPQPTALPFARQLGGSA